MFQKFLKIKLEKEATAKINNTFLSRQKFINEEERIIAFLI